jgi:hypothetical protein
MRVVIVCILSILLAMTTSCGTTDSQSRLALVQVACESAARFDILSTNEKWSELVALDPLFLGAAKGARDWAIRRGGVISSRVYSELTVEAYKNRGDFWAVCSPYLPDNNRY